MRVLLRVNVGIVVWLQVVAAANLANWPVEPDDGIVAVLIGTLRHLINHLMMRAFRSTIDGSPIPG